MGLWSALVTGLAAEDPSNGAHGTVEAYDHVQRMFVLALQSRGAAEEGGEEAGEGRAGAARRRFKPRNLRRVSRTIVAVVWTSAVRHVS